MAALLRLTEPGAAADLPVAMPVKAPPISAAYDWTDFYLGDSFRLCRGELGLDRQPDRSGDAQYLRLARPASTVRSFQ